MNDIKYGKDIVRNVIAAVKNVWSLYRRIYYQLNTTSISDRLQRYVDKMASITTLPSNPREPKQ